MKKVQQNVEKKNSVTESGEAEYNLKVRKKKAECQSVH